MVKRAMVAEETFQSTLSMRRATSAPAAAPAAVAETFQSTLSMRRATGPSLKYATAQVQFQSTLSMRRATQQVMAKRKRERISIHALHEESDPQGMGGTTGHRHFNPRSP